MTITKTQPWVQCALYQEDFFPPFTFLSMSSRAFLRFNSRSWILSRWCCARISMLIKTACRYFLNWICAMPKFLVEDEIFTDEEANEEDPCKELPPASSFPIR